MALMAMPATSERGERSRARLQLLGGSRPLTQAQSSLRREIANMRKTFRKAELELGQALRQVRFCKVGTHNQGRHSGVLADSRCPLFQGMLETLHGDIDIARQQLEDACQRNRCSAEVLALYASADLLSGKPQLA